MVPESILVEILVELIERLRKKNNKLKRKILARDQTVSSDSERISELEEVTRIDQVLLIEQSKLLDELSYLNSGDVKDLLKKIAERVKGLIQISVEPPSVLHMHQRVRSEANAILHVLNEIDCVIRRQPKGDT